MTKSAISWIVGAVTLVTIGGAGYYYYAYVMPDPVSAPVQMPPEAAPDTSVAAGAVAAVSSRSISIIKQDGTTATFAITSTTAIVMSAEGRPGDPATVGAIQAGALVLITPSAGDAAAAETIVLLPGPAN